MADALSDFMNLTGAFQNFTSSLGQLVAVRNEIATKKVDAELHRKYSEFALMAARPVSEGGIPTSELMGRFDKLNSDVDSYLEGIESPMVRDSVRANLAGRIDQYKTNLANAVIPRVIKEAQTDWQATADNIRSMPTSNAERLSMMDEHFKLAKSKELFDPATLYKYERDVILPMKGSAEVDARVASIAEENSRSIRDAAEANAAADSRYSAEWESRKERARMAAGEIVAGGASGDERRAARRGGGMVGEESGTLSVLGFDEAYEAALAAEPTPDAPVYVNPTLKTISLDLIKRELVEDGSIPLDLKAAAISDVDARIASQDARVDEYLTANESLMKSGLPVSEYDKIVTGTAMMPASDKKHSEAYSKVAEFAVPTMVATMNSIAQVAIDEYDPANIEKSNAAIDAANQALVEYGVGSAFESDEKFQEEKTALMEMLQKKKQGLDGGVEDQERILFDKIRSDLLQLEAALDTGGISGLDVATSLSKLYAPTYRDPRTGQYKMGGAYSSEFAGMTTRIREKFLKLGSVTPALDRVFSNPDYMGAVAEASKYDPWVMANKGKVNELAKVLTGETKVSATSDLSMKANSIKTSYFQSMTEFVQQKPAATDAELKEHSAKVLAPLLEASVKGYMAGEKPLTWFGAEGSNISELVSMGDKDRLEVLFPKDARGRQVIPSGMKENLKLVTSYASMVLAANQDYTGLSGDQFKSLTPVLSGGFSTGVLRSDGKAPLPGAVEKVSAGDLAFLSPDKKVAYTVDRSSDGKTVVVNGWGYDEKTRSYTTFLHSLRGPKAKAAEDEAKRKASALMAEIEANYFVDLGK